MLKKILKNPPLMIVLTFTFTIIIGTLLLLLPFATHHGISFSNAFFTSTSAVCVTGLVVYDTGTDFTTFGQFIILLLIQIGGIGILSLSVIFIILLTNNIGFVQKNWVEESLTQNRITDIRLFLKNVILFVIGIEAIGAVLLFFGFIVDYSWPRSLFLAIFHSVSAFCNAGFSLFSDSMEQYRTSIYINIVIISLIVTGGIGFIVFVDVAFRLTKKSRALSFHSKIVLSSTLVLILGAAIFIWLLEYKKSFADYSSIEKICAAVFQSVTCRTAGFNSVAITNLSSATLFLFLLLMFIGGSPGSTAGGVKTTSFTLFVFLLWSRLCGRPRPEIFRRTVSEKIVERVLTLMVASAVLVGLAIFSLLISEQALSETPRSFFAITFEAVSAFGTTGLSMGITPSLSLTGKWIIIFLMFIGRIGPLTLVVLMMEEKELDYEYPEEEIMVG